MCDRLYSFLEKKESLYEHQFGLRNSCSTTNALTEITKRKSGSIVTIVCILMEFFLI